MHAHAHIQALLPQAIIAHPPAALALAVLLLDAPERVSTAEVAAYRLAAGKGCVCVCVCVCVCCVCMLCVVCMHVCVESVHSQVAPDINLCVC